MNILRRVFTGGALLFALALTGCVSQMNETMKSWEGKHFSDLIACWGPPSHVLDDGQGGQIYCYQSTGAYTTPGSARTTGNAYSFGNTATYYGTLEGLQRAQPRYNPRVEQARGGRMDFAPGAGAGRELAGGA